MGPLAQSAFVDEEDRAALAERFFLSWGQRTFFHCWIACSSRSRARPVGRWQLQLSLRRMRHTCEESYRTPCCCSISLATRASVHSPLRYPNCSGPCLRHCSSCAISASFSLGGRPARLGLLKHSQHRSFYIPLASQLSPEGLKVDRDTANARVGTWLREVANARTHATTGQVPVPRQHQ